MGVWVKEHERAHNAYTNRQQGASVEVVFQLMIPIWRFKIED